MSTIEAFFKTTVVKILTALTIGALGGGAGAYIQVKDNTKKINELIDAAKLSKKVNCRLALKVFSKKEIREIEKICAGT